MNTGRRLYRQISVVALVAGGVALSGCGAMQPSSDGAKNQTGTNTTIQAVAAENAYGNVLAQIGGQYVNVTSIMVNPNIDPHSYEASTKDAAFVGGAALVVQNGLGYDGFMNKLEGATPSAGRTVIDVAAALGYGANTRNPHLWYNPATMPKVANLFAQTLSRIEPAQAAYFHANLQRFDHSLRAWEAQIARLKRLQSGAPVAVTEPIGDYLLQAAGLTNQTPWSFQAAVMNGVDPSPQTVQQEENLLIHHQVKTLLYNRQAVDSVTTTLLQLAMTRHIPVVGLYETMPPTLTYQTWMEAETRALLAALQNGTSTETIA